MTSLRWRLVITLWAALAVIGSGSAAYSYVYTRQSTNALLDYQLAQIAGFLGAQDFTGITSAAMNPPPPHHEHEDDVIVTVRGRGGKLLYASGNPGPIPPLSTLGYQDMTLQGASYRVFSAQAGTRRIAVAQQLETREEIAADAALSALLPIAILLPLLGLIIIFVIRHQLRPLRQAAAEVAARKPMALQALPITGLPDEIRPLIDAINHLLARLHDALEIEQRFIADAAHALRTPLTALQLQADVLDGSVDSSERAARLDELRAGIRRTTHLADQLLTLHQHPHDAAAVTAHTSLSRAITEIVSNYHAAANKKNLHFHLALTDANDVEVPGDTRQLALIFGNLLDNALRYSAAGGTITITCRRQRSTVNIEISDEGPGLPDTELSTVFARFYRIAGDRTMGNGLGLATVHSLVQLLGGAVSLSNRTDRSGLLACVTLPLITQMQSA
ncbi:MAG TPA: ATP-binding protein [Stenotrophobium sp.]|jgi:two-component system OmpR family sensor kinase|nr:ATP-binding protein [Stenotrophobium sp.]